MELELLSNLPRLSDDRLSVSEGYLPVQLIDDGNKEFLALFQ